MNNTSVTQIEICIFFASLEGSYREKQKTVLLISSKSIAREKGEGHYLAGKTSAAAAAYTTIYTHRLTLYLSI